MLINQLLLFQWTHWNNDPLKINISILFSELGSRCQVSLWVGSWRREIIHIRCFIPVRPLFFEYLFHKTADHSWNLPQCIKIDFYSFYYYFHANPPDNDLKYAEQFVTVLAETLSQPISNCTRICWKDGDSCLRWQWHVYCLLFADGSRSKENDHGSKKQKYWRDCKILTKGRMCYRKHCHGPDNHQTFQWISLSNWIWI